MKKEIKALMGFEPGHNGKRGFTAGCDSTY